MVLNFWFALQLKQKTIPILWRFNDEGFNQFDINHHIK